MRIIAIKATSKALPAGVSASKMISKTRSCQLRVPRPLVRPHRHPTQSRAGVAKRKRRSGAVRPHGTGGRQASMGRPALPTRGNFLVFRVARRNPCCSRPFSSIARVPPRSLARAATSGASAPFVSAKAGTPRHPTRELSSSGRFCAPACDRSLGRALSAAGGVFAPGVLRAREVGCTCTPNRRWPWTAPTLREIYRRLPHGRTLFPYFRDRYAFQLLSWAARDVDSLRLLRKGAHGHMLEKPSVRAHLAQLPQDRVPADFFDSYWPGTTRHFRLRVGGWGHDKFWGPRLQTSRPGWNLVLRLDLPASHWRRYVRLVRPDQHWFQMEGHPTTPLPTVTLAWLRIDVDLERGEALIEEIQNDWLRLARDFHQFLLEPSGIGTRPVREGSLCRHHPRALDDLPERRPRSAGADLGRGRAHGGPPRAS